MIEDGRPRVIDPADDSDDEAGLSIDEVCHLLQNGRRRGVLRYLRGTDGGAEMSDIAERIAAAENDTTVERLGHAERKRVYIALYQTHLPKLDDSGIIEYDRERGDVVATPAAERLYDAMDAVSPDAGPDPEPDPEDPDADADADRGADPESDAGSESDADRDADADPGSGRPAVGSSATAVVLSGLAAVLGVGVGRSALPVVAGLLLASTSHVAIGTVRGRSD